jgi:hypothetical protein
MKIKLLLTLMVLFTFVGLEVSGQVGKGLFLGGSLGLETGGGKRTTKIGSVSTEVDVPKVTNFSITPRVGYFFTDNIGAGLILSYGSGNEVDKGDKAKTITRSTSRFSVGIFGRYAKRLWSSDFYFAGDLAFGFGVTNGSVKEERNNVTTTVDDPTRTTISIDLTPSILYFPAPKIGLEAGLGSLVSFSTTSASLKSDNSEVTESYNNFRLFKLSSLQFTFGLNYYFNR